MTIQSTPPPRSSLLSRFRSPLSVCPWPQLLWAQADKGAGYTLIQALIRGLAIPYDLAVTARRYLYRQGCLTSHRLPTCVVSLGNLTVGGTGKTPVTAALAQTLTARGLKVVILSRGYGGTARSVTCISNGRQLYHRPQQVGDEPYWLARTLPGVPVYTGAHRYQAGLAACQAHRPDIILLDDAFQHLSLQRDLDIVLLDAHAPFGNGRLLPAGPLRERPHTLASAQVIVLTRYHEARHRSLFEDLRQTFPHKLLLTATIVPTKARMEPQGEEHPPQALAGQPLFAFAGVAQPAVFAQTLSDLGVTVTGFQAFPDHHPYSPADIKHLLAAAHAHGARALITTTKDWVRLADQWHGTLPLWVLEVQAKLAPEHPVIDKIALLAAQTRTNPALAGTPITPVAGRAPIPTPQLPDPPELLPLPPAVQERFARLRPVGRLLPEPAAVQRLLVQAPNWLGDAIMCLPVLSALRGFFPQADITVWATPQVASLFGPQPEVAAVQVYSRRGPRCLFAGVSAGQFQMAVILPNSFASALATYLAHIPHRLGYAADGRRLLLSRAVVGRRRLLDVHHLFYYLGLLTGVGTITTFNPPRLYLTPTDQNEATKLLGDAAGNENQPLVGLCPGAAYGPAKRWPPERFAALGKALHDEFQARLVILGSSAEAPLAEIISDNLNGGVLNLSGQTSLRQVLGVLSRLRLLITNDSGLMHAAAALGTPLVAIFGSTDPRLTGPFSPRATVIHHPLPCTPCRRRTCTAGRDYECLRRITVAEVLAAARPWLLLDPVPRPATTPPAADGAA